VLASAGPSAGRPHLARALVEAGVVPSVDAAFTELLAPHGPYYAEKADTPLRRAVEMIATAGGVSVLAHTRARKRGRLLALADIRDLATVGLGGSSAFSGRVVASWVGCVSGRVVLPALLLTLARAGAADTPPAEAPPSENNDSSPEKTSTTVPATTMGQLAWLWLRNQPDSALSVWYRERVRDGKGRIKRIAITALARKLLVALWRFVTHGLVPTGAVLKSSKAI